MAARPAPAPRGPEHCEPGGYRFGGRKPDPATRAPNKASRGRPGRSFGPPAAVPDPEPCHRHRLLSAAGRPPKILDYPPPGGLSGAPSWIVFPIRQMRRPEAGAPSSRTTGISCPERQTTGPSGDGAPGYPRRRSRRRGYSSSLAPARTVGPVGPRGFYGGRFVENPARCAPSRRPFPWPCTENPATVLRRRLVH